MDALRVRNEKYFKDELAKTDSLIKEYKANGDKHNLQVALKFKEFMHEKHDEIIDTWIKYDKQNANYLKKHFEYDKFHDEYKQEHKKKGKQNE